MEPIYSQEFQINAAAVDCYGRLKPSMLLLYIQEVATVHGSAMGVSHDVLAEKNLFWAILRTKVQITRLPRLDETIRLDTWPMPTTRVAYPRSVVAYDQQGEEIFRAISLWASTTLYGSTMCVPSVRKMSSIGEENAKAKSLRRSSVVLCLCPLSNASTRKNRAGNPVRSK